MSMLSEHPIIAAVRTKSEFTKALSAKTETVFLLAGAITDLPMAIDAAKRAGKKLYLHMDMIDGLGKDAAAVDYVASLGLYGIISTRGNIIKAAKNAGLYTVQRFFIVDGRSVTTALDTLHQTKPTYAELMPGLVYKAIKAFHDGGFPIIAGGLIGTPDEVKCALDAGACAVSTSEQALWNHTK